MSTSSTARIKGLSLLWGVYGVMAVLVLGCGGGSQSQIQPPARTLEFVLTVGPTRLAVVQGGSSQLTVGVQASEGFNSTVNASIGTLPSGISAAPNEFPLNPSGQQNVDARSSRTFFPTVVSELRRRTSAIARFPSVRGSAPLESLDYYYGFVVNAVLFAIPAQIVISFESVID